MQASGALPDAACRSWAPQQVAQKKPAAPEQAPAPAATAAAPAASLHNGRLIIITPSASSAAAEAAWQLPSSHAVQPCQEGKREQSQWPPGHSPQAGKRAADKAAAGDSSGDEASDKVWQTNWGLDLFSALNPSVITTGTAPALKPALAYEKFCPGLLIDLLGTLARCYCRQGGQLRRMLSQLLATPF